MKKNVKDLKNYKFEEENKKYLTRTLQKQKFEI